MSGIDIESSRGAIPEERDAGDHGMAWHCMAKIPRYMPCIILRARGCIVALFGGGSSHAEGAMRVPREDMNAGKREYP